jgi:hypothetical protein
VARRPVLNVVLPRRLPSRMAQSDPLSAQEKNATVVTPIRCPPPRLLAEYRIIATLITRATLLLSVQIATLLFTGRSEVASLADAVLSGR